jgi:hypothetical protein
LTDVIRDCLAPRVQQQRHEIEEMHRNSVVQIQSLVKINKQFFRPESTKLMRKITREVRPRIER